MSIYIIIKIKKDRCDFHMTGRQMMMTRENQTKSGRGSRLDTTFICVDGDFLYVHGRWKSPKVESELLVSAGRAEQQHHVVVT